MKERAGDLELINPCGRIPLIFQCTLGSGQLPKRGLKIPCATRRFKFPTCLEPRLPQELRQLYYSELKIPESCFFWSLKGRGERAKIDYFSLELGLFGEHWEVRVPELCPKGSSKEVTAAGSHWAFHPLPAPHGCLSFVPIWICCSVGSAPTLEACWRQFRGQIREYWGVQGIPTHPCVIYCTCSHQEPRTDVLDPTSTSLCPHYQETTQALHPKRSWQELKALLHCKMNQASTDMQSVPPAS